MNPHVSPSSHSSRIWFGSWLISRSFLGRRTRTTLATIVLLLVAFGLRTVGVAEATGIDQQTVPAIHCAWAMANAGTSDTFEYGPEDNTSTAMIESEAACKLDPLRIASQVENSQGLLHVQGTNPNQREIELWAAVSHPSSDAFGIGLGSVSWTVHKPNGDVLAQVERSVRTCAGDDAPGQMWNTAATAYSHSGSGAFAMTTVSNATGTGLWQACRQGQIRVFSARTTLPANAPCGSYSIRTTATVDTAKTTLDYGIDVLCPVSAILDAVNVHWDVSPGGTAVVRGDLDPTTTNSPTVTNNGDRPVQVGLIFSALIRPDMSDSIAEFGATVLGKDGSLAGAPRLDANEEGWISGPSSVLCPGKSMPINLVVHAPVDLAPGEYSGSVRVLARAGGRC
jgi:hypothetical protein